MENSSYSILLHLHSILPPVLKKKLISAIILMFITSISEIMGLGLVIPFIYSLAEPSLVVDALTMIIPSEYIPRGKSLTISMFLAFISIISLSYTLKIYNLSNYNRLAYHCGQTIIADIFNYHMMQDYKHFRKIKSSHLYDMYTNKTYILVNNILIPLISMLSSIITVIFGLTILLYVEPLNSVLIVGVIAAIYLILIFSLRGNITFHGTQTNTSSQNLVDIVQQTFLSIREIKLYKQEERTIREFKLANEKLRSSQAALQILTQVPRLIVELLAIILITLIATITVLRGEAWIEIITTIIFLAMTGQKLFPYFQQIYHSYASFKSGRDHYDSIFANFQPESNSRNDPIKNKDKVSENFKSIRLQNVSIQLDDMQVIKNFSASFERGKIVGIKGITGSGKSTLAEAVIGLIPISTGTIFINDREVAYGEMSQYQECFAYVTQDVHVYSASIRENIFFSTEQRACFSEVYKASQLDRWIATLENGDMEILAENGYNISGGQKQRIGIARALARSASLIIMDEATSALDEKTQEELMKHLKTLDCCIIFITHRDNTLCYCDEVIEL